ncbi:MAG: hypothetical protein ACRDT5_03565 [Mycobacterium sp.]
MTKYRRPVFTNDMLTFCENTMAVLSSGLVEFNPPTLAIATLVPRLNGPTTHAVQREYSGHCVNVRKHRHL